MSTSASLLGFILGFSLLGAATLHQIQHTRVGSAHDAVHNAAVSAADCARRIACDDPSRFGGVARGELSGARIDGIRACGMPFLRPLEGGDAAEIAVEPQFVLEGADLTVTVRVPFACTIPLAGSIACGDKREVALLQQERVIVSGCDQRD